MGIHYPLGFHLWGHLFHQLFNIFDGDGVSVGLLDERCSLGSKHGGTSLEVGVDESYDPEARLELPKREKGERLSKQWRLQ